MNEPQASENTVLHESKMACHNYHTLNKCNKFYANTLTLLPSMLKLKKRFFSHQPSSGFCSTMILDFSRARMFSRALNNSSGIITHTPSIGNYNSECIRFSLYCIVSMESSLSEISLLVLAYIPLYTTPLLSAQDHCLGNNCSHICALSASHPAGYRCLCPVGLELDTNGSQCRGRS